MTPVASEATLVVPLTLVARSAPQQISRRRSEPVCTGVPFPRGLLRDVDGLTLCRNAAAAALQARVLDRWPDGSARWVLLDFFADVGDGIAEYALRVDTNTVAAETAVGVTAHRLGDDVFVNTGVATFRLCPGPRFSICANGDSPLIDTDRTQLSVSDEDGQPRGTCVDRVNIEEHGPVRATVLVEGRTGLNGPEPLVFFSRLHFFGGSPTVRFDVTVRNPRSAQHSGGLWDLGDAASVLLQDLAFTIALPKTEGTVETRWAVEPEAIVERCAGDFELYQDSSGGENWRSSSHMNRKHHVPNTFRGYRVRADGSERFGLRAAPTVTIARVDHELTVAVPHFWQNFPKALEVSGDVVTLRLFPRQYADLHEIQGGEQKTHTFFVAFGRDGVTEQPLAWCHSPLVVHADPSWYCSSGTLPYVVSIDSNPDRAYVDLVNAAIEGDDTFEHKREVIDEYGWRHFGDVYGDHEQVYAGERQTPIVSHYNNQYDVVAGFAYRFMSTGDLRWFDAMNELAAHVVDIDIYHTGEDKAAYNHGLFWHTYHYIDADIATHRSYPSAAKAIVKGGGPSAEQNYATGLMLHYFLTGNEASRQTAIGLAQFVIDIDDGAKTVFRWLDRGATGLASASGSPLYHGPGRGSGNSLSVLMDGHRLSGNPAFLTKAETLIRRCIHPADDIAARDLLDVERKWFYTMFLQSLGKYLDYKAERGEIDAMYAYARASLLHYARWMAANERPYLDRPEVLEYPTETWAAQDIRKSDVFYFAAMHASGDERERFLERGEFFFLYSVTTLRSMTTRTFARPVVVLLTSGLLHAHLRLFPAAARPRTDKTDASASISFGEPASFVPQRIRAVRRFRTLASAVAFIAMAFLAWMAMRYFG